MRHHKRLWVVAERVDSRLEFVVGAEAGLWWATLVRREYGRCVLHPGRRWCHAKVGVRPERGFSRHGVELTV